jgi:hypothetical protein
MTRMVERARGAIFAQMAWPSRGSAAAKSWHFPATQPGGRTCKPATPDGVRIEAMHNEIDRQRCRLATVEFL